MKLSFIERNGRKYAYTCTSRRVPGKKNPVSQMTYVGAVDPDTGDIIPKRINGSTHHEIPDEAEIKNFGNASLVLSIAKNLGILEDLETSFGERSRMILAISLAQALRPSHTDSVDITLKSSYIPELLGLERIEISKKNIIDTVNSIDHDSIDNFFKLRRMRIQGRILVFSHAVSLSNHSHNTLEDLSGLRNIDDATMVIAAGDDGSMIGFSLEHCPPTDVTGPIRVMKLLESRGIESIYVSNTSSSPSIRLDEFVIRNLDFIIPYSVASPQFHQMSNNYDDISDSVYTHDYNNIEYQMKEGSVGLIAEDERYILITTKDPRFGKYGALLKSFMVFDPCINNDAVKSMNTFVKSIKTRLDGMTSDDPSMALSIAAGQFAPLLRCIRKTDGTLSVSVKRDAMSQFRKNAGKALILTRSSSWNDVIKARDALISINTTSEQFYKGSKWVMKYVGKKTNIEGQIFTEFIALLIYDSICKTAKSNKESLSADDILFIASTYKISSVNGKTVHSPMNQKLLKVFKMFGLAP